MAVRQCGSVCVAVCSSAAVCDSLCAAVCGGSARGSVRQCVAVCGSAHGSVHAVRSAQCPVRVAVCGSVWQYAAVRLVVYGDAPGFVRQCAL
jgi:hypothetical protein